MDLPADASLIRTHKTIGPYLVFFGLLAVGLLAGCVGANADTVAVQGTQQSASSDDLVSGASGDESEASPSTAPPRTLRLTPLPEKAAAETPLPTTPATVTTSTTVPLVPSDELTLERIENLTGNLSSKSVVASGQGLFFAQNMMYRHTVSVFNRDEQLVATIPDSVDLSEFGVEVEPGSYQGAPVEAAFSSDGRYGYVSNYRMYGPGFSSTASDNCNKGEGKNSFVYRIDTELVVAAGPEGVGPSPIDAVYEVGSVPKFLAITPDDRYLLVTNWCTFDLSVVDLETGVTSQSIPLGRHPRGIVVSSDSKTAYVTVMGGSDIAVIDLGTFDVEWIENVGAAPRHLMISPDDQTLYSTLNGEGTVIKIDLTSGEVVDRVRTGIAPRSMSISDDGLTLYVVNYESDTMSRVRSSDFEILQTIKTAHHPIGITFDRESREVWVSCYSGVIHVYRQVLSDS